MQYRMCLSDTITITLTERGLDAYRSCAGPLAEPPKDMKIWRFAEVFGPEIRAKGAHGLFVRDEVVIALDEHELVNAGKLSALISFDERIAERDRYDGVRDGTILDYLNDCGGELAKLREEKAEAARKRDLLGDAIAAALGEDWRTRSPVEAIRALARRSDDHDRSRIVAVLEEQVALGQARRGRPAFDVVRERAEVDVMDMAPSEGPEVIFMLRDQGDTGPATLENSVMAVKLNRQTGDVELLKSQTGIGVGATLLGLKREIDDLHDDLDEKRRLLDKAIAEKDEWRREYRQLLHGRDAAPESYEDSIACALGQVDSPSPSAQAMSEFFAKVGQPTPAAAAALRRLGVEPPQASDQPTRLDRVQITKPADPVAAATNKLAEAILDGDLDLANRLLDLLDRMEERER